MKVEATLDDMRNADDYDWRHVFAYASGESDTPSFVPPTPGRDAASYGLPDVAEVVASVNGENDGAQWGAVGRLKSGAWFYVEAGCDYTGWG